MSPAERARLEKEAAHARLQQEANARREARRELQLRRAQEKEKKLQDKLAKCPACHWGLLVATILLALLSIPIVYSASTTLALDRHDNADFFLLRQVGFVALGLAWFGFVSRRNVRQLRVGIWGAYVLVIAGLLAIAFTPLGVDLGSGTERWLKLPFMPLQVSEIAKFALIGVLADFWSRASRTSQTRMWPWLAAGALSLPIIGLVFVQPHLSAALLLGTLPFIVAAHADVPRKHFVRILAPLVLCGVVTVVACKNHAVPFLKTYQQDRIAKHFGGEEDARGGNYQVLQSQRALVNGGIFGVGPGDSVFKQGHLPAPHTDFIMAVIGEEWGLAGLLVLLGLYTAIIFFCLHIGHCAETSFEALLCSGVGTLLAIQVLGNAFVVTALCR
jgi:cell division protein FtsW